MAAGPGAANLLFYVECVKSEWGWGDKGRARHVCLRPSSTKKLCPYANVQQDSAVESYGMHCC